MMTDIKKIMLVAVVVVSPMMAAPDGSFDDLHVEGKLKVHGKSKFRDKAKFKDDVKISDDLKVKGTAKISDLEVSDSTVLNGSVTFGSSTSQTDFIINGNLSFPANSATAGNILVGGQPLFNVSGVNSSFFGLDSGNFTATGTGNSAFGTNALGTVTTGGNNFAGGTNTLAANTTGGSNVAVGQGALQNNTAGSENTAVGNLSLNLNTTGSRNTALGSEALLNNTEGASNVALGQRALFNNIIGSGNIAIGLEAGGMINGDNNIMIANDGFVDDFNTIRIGNTQTRTFIAGIRGVTTGMTNGVAVFVDSQNQLGTVSSSARFKENIEEIGTSSELLMKLRPVVFNYTEDEGKSRQYGFIAEEVAQIYPELVVLDENGMPYTIKYHLLYALLLNEIQKNHLRIAQHDQMLESIDGKVEQAMNDYVAQIQGLLARVVALENMNKSPRVRA